MIFYVFNLIMSDVKRYMRNMNYHSRLIDTIYDIFENILPIDVIGYVLSEYIANAKLDENSKELTWNINEKSSMICTDRNIYISLDEKGDNAEQQKLSLFVIDINTKLRQNI